MPLILATQKKNNTKTTSPIKDSNNTQPPETPTGKSLGAIPEGPNGTWKISFGRSSGRRENNVTGNGRPKWTPSERFWPQPAVSVEPTVMKRPKPKGTFGPAEACCPRHRKHISVRNRVVSCSDPGLSGPHGRRLRTTPGPRKTRTAAQHLWWTAASAVRARTGVAFRAPDQDGCRIR